MEYTVDKNDELVMKLLHYFITEQNYSPIILQGAQNEIWLENLNNEHKIVRIVTNYIHNDEQFDFDIYRTKQIMKKIKKKTMSFSLNALSIFLNLGDNVNTSETNFDNIDCVYLNNIEDLENYDVIKEEFPTITQNTEFKDTGYKWEYKSIDNNFGVKIGFESQPITSKVAANSFGFKSASSLLNNTSNTNNIDVSMYREGQNVYHKKFGEGIITKAEVEGNDMKLDIEFEKSGKKRLMAKFANLEVLN